MLLNQHTIKIGHGTSYLKWVHYYFIAKCVEFEPYYKVGPDKLFDNQILK
jgi:hypothetical protein